MLQFFTLSFSPAQCKHDWMLNSHRKAPVCTPFTPIMTPGLHKSNSSVEMGIITVLLYFLFKLSKNVGSVGALPACEIFCVWKQPHSSEASSWSRHCIKPGGHPPLAPGSFISNSLLLLTETLVRIQENEAFTTNWNRAHSPLKFVRNSVPFYSELKMDYLRYVITYFITPKYILKTSGKPFCYGSYISKWKLVWSF